MSKGVITKDMGHVDIPTLKQLAARIKKRMIQR